MAGNNDPGPDKTKDELANHDTAPVDAGVMHGGRRQQQQQRHPEPSRSNSGPGLHGNLKDSSNAEAAATPDPGALPDANEPYHARQHRANSRRASFSRPTPVFRPAKLADAEDANGSRSKRGPDQHATHQLGRLVGQIQEWIDHERAKVERKDGDQMHKFDLRHSLERLQNILRDGHHLSDDPAVGNSEGSALPQQSTENQNAQVPRDKRSSISLRRLGRTPTFSSDTENEADRHPPTVDVVLDNSKTLSYSAPSTTDLTRRVTNADAWHAFKTEILKLSHTLKLKGWRRVPLENGDDIDVQRLSGALTNAVYVVNPPSDLPESALGEVSIPRPPPSKLLLRIYGPQVEHLIDRESELAILRRLARKNIGPKLLGTFTNGRFEEYLNATTLTPNDIRDPTFSQQIAKRMRELHVGINLLPQEREAGPFVWQNWDKWKERCEEVIEWLDEQIKGRKDSRAPSRKRLESWRGRGLVCGVEWKIFRSAVRKYRSWLEEQYGGLVHILESLVFAHNDTQYGNLLRLMPDDEASPLLRPANEYRRLVVIDFEYANANTPGLEFANHFTEWCYNYHSSSEPHACVVGAYPSVEEQKRFIRAYVSHVPHFRARTPGATPVLAARSSPNFVASPSPAIRPQLRGSISHFTLDSRGPPGGSSGSYGLSSSIGSQSGSYLANRAYEEEERAREEALDSEVARLMHETRLWRIANSAQWVAWGIVQAKVSGMEQALAAQKARQNVDDKNGSKSTVEVLNDTVAQLKTNSESGISGQQPGEDDGGDEEQEEEEEEFDYLAYAQERALFFWGDILTLGLVSEDELPKDLIEKAKRINR